MTVPFVHTLKNFRPLKAYFIQNRLALAVGLGSLLLVDFLQLLIPLIIKKAINLLTIQSDPETGIQLLKYALMIGGIALVVTIFRYTWRHMIMGHSRKVEMHLRSRIYGHVQTLSPSFFKRTKTGDLMARAINDINSVRMASGMGLVAFVDGAVLGTAAVGFMISIDMRLTLIALIPAPIVILFTRALTKRMSERFEAVQKTFADLTEQVRESFRRDQSDQGPRQGKLGIRQDGENGGEICVREHASGQDSCSLFPHHEHFFQCGPCHCHRFGGALCDPRPHYSGRFCGLHCLPEPAHLAHDGHGMGDKPDPERICLHATH